MIYIYKICGTCHQFVAFGHVFVVLLSGDQGHLIRIHADAIMYDAANLPLTDADYDIWASGLRNPFRLDIFKPTGDIYIADVGAITVEVR